MGKWFVRALEAWSPSTLAVHIEIQELSAWMFSPLVSVSFLSVFICLFGYRNWRIDVKLTNYSLHQNLENINCIWFLWNIYCVSTNIYLFKSLLHWLKWNKHFLIRFNWFCNICTGTVFTCWREAEYLWTRGEDVSSTSPL